MASQPTHNLGQRESRELAARETDGLHVQLLWNPIADALSVAVDDLRALDAFYDPFAYAT